MGGALVRARARVPRARARMGARKCVTGWRAPIGRRSGGRRECAGVCVCVCVRARASTCVRVRACVLVLASERVHF